MAKQTITFHVCDRCGEKMDKPFWGGETGTFTLSGVEDFAVAGGAGIRWHELCGPCNWYVGRLISDLQEDQKAARLARTEAT